MSLLSFWQWVLQELRSGNDIALLVVIAHSKGSPGKRGFKLALTAQGHSVGTIGGGIMEVNMSRFAQKALREKQPKTKIVPQYHHKQAAQWQSGMICAGHQELLLCLLETAVLPIIEEIVEKLENNEPASIAITSNGLQLQQTNSSAAGTILYEETLGFENTLCIIGGGHVGSALAKVGWDLGFYVHVIDFRPNLPTLVDQRHIHQLSLLPFADLRKVMHENLQNTYAVVVSTSAASDEIALREIVELPLAYIGLMGSPTKIAHIFANLQAFGIARSALDRVHAPVGIDIQSESAEEIAVSIAAQLIREKNSRKNLINHHFPQASHLHNVEPAL